MEAYNEYLEEYVEKSSDETRNVLLDLCSYSEKQVFELKDKLNIVSLKLREVLSFGDNTTFCYSMKKLIIQGEINKG